MRDKLNLFLYFLKKDIKVKFAGSGLGLLWSIIVPVIQVVLFWFVFAEILKARPYANMEMPYIYFLLSSFFFWLAFSEGIFRSAHVIIENSEIIKKISFPHVILPVTVTASSYILNMIGFLFFIIFYTVSTTLSPFFLWIIPVLSMQFIFSLGIGMLLAALLPYVRDIGQMLGHIMQATFFLSPIIYSMEAVPDKLKTFLYLNPMTYFASSYHKIILFHEPPSLLFFGVIVCISMAAFWGGYYAFRKLNDGFADVL